jgi:hypothetical protein
MTLIEVTAEEAQAHGLPPLFCRVEVTGSSLSVGKFGGPNTYLTASGPPGGTPIAIVSSTDERETDAAAIEPAVRKQYYPRVFVRALEERARSDVP